MAKRKSEAAIPESLAAAAQVASELAKGTADAAVKALDKAAAAEGAEHPNGVIAQALLDFVADVPTTAEKPTKVSVDQEKEAADRAQAIASAAARKASAVSATLALPPGPFGLLTIIPDLVAIWRVQGQMVADIAGVYGKTAALSSEQMLYCLFRHTAAQAVRDLAVRVGERVVVRRLGMAVLRPIVGNVAALLVGRLIAKSMARLLPLIGALGVGAYAYYDTAQVAHTAIDLFQSDVHVEQAEDAGKPARKPAKMAKADKAAATVKATPTKGDAKKEMPKKAPPKSEPPKNAARKKAAPKKSESTKAAPPKAVTKKAAPPKAAPKKATAKKVAPKKAATPAKGATKRRGAK